MEPVPPPAEPSAWRATRVTRLARCRPGLVSSSRPPATTAAASTQNPSAPVAPSVSESRSRAPGGSVASKCRNPASPVCSPTQRATNAAASAPPSSPAIASGPCLRTANTCPSTPEITPPARQTRQNAASAAMNAVVSALTRAAAPGAVITSSGRGATAAQPRPATTPSAAVPAATARSAPPRRRGPGRGRESAQTWSPAAYATCGRPGTAAVFEAGGKPCYGEVRDCDQSSEFSVRQPAEPRKSRDRGTGAHQALKGQARGRPPVVPGGARPGDRVPRAKWRGQVNDDAAGSRPGPARGWNRDDQRQAL